MCLDTRKPEKKMMGVNERKNEWTNETMRHNYDYGKIDCDRTLIAWEMEWMLMWWARGMWHVTLNLSRKSYAMAMKLVCQTVWFSTPVEWTRTNEWTSCFPCVFVSLLDECCFTDASLNTHPSRVRCLCLAQNATKCSFWSVCACVSVLLWMCSFRHPLSGQGCF